MMASGADGAWVQKKLARLFHLVIADGDTMQDDLLVLPVPFSSLGGQLTSSTSMAGPISHDEPTMALPVIVLSRHSRSGNFFGFSSLFRWRLSNFATWMVSS